EGYLPPCGFFDFVSAIPGVRIDNDVVLAGQVVRWDDGDLLLRIASIDFVEANDGISMVMVLENLDSQSTTSSSSFSVEPQDGSGPEQHVAFGEQVAFHLPMTITTDSFIVGPIGVPLPLPVLNFGSVQFQIDSLTQKLVGDDIVLGLAVSVLRSSDNALLRRPNTATDFEKFQNTYNSGPLRSYNDWGLELDQWLVERLVESLDDSVFPSNMTDVAIT